MSKTETEIYLELIKQGKDHNTAIHDAKEIVAVERDRERANPPEEKPAREPEVNE